MDERGDPKPPASPPRLGYCLRQAAALSVFWGVLMVAARYEVIFTQLGMSRLPFPTEALLGVGRWSREYLTVLGLPLIGLVLIGLTLAGKLDRYLRKLIIANILWMAIMIPWAVLSLHMPIRMIEEHLRDR